jgi:protein ImuB
VDRLACLDLPALPLQLLLRRHRSWKGQPVVVVDRETPQGQVLHANAEARAAGIGPGWRHGAALAFCPGLRAAEVPRAQLEDTVAELCALLRDFTPHVEPSADAPGVFWLDARGLGRLQPSLAAWAASVRARLARETLRGALAVGFSRFATCAVARGLRGRRAVVFSSPETEREAARRVPLTRLELAPDARAALEALAVVTLADLARLPGAGLRQRFGPEVHRLHRQAQGELGAPVQPQAPGASFVARLDLDRAEDDRERLLFATKPLLDRLLAQLEAGGQAVAGLELRLDVDRASPFHESLRPAAPSVDGVQLLGLLRLRLESLALGAGVTGLELEAVPTPATPEQLRLFAQKPRRDLAAAARAFARLRASLGDAAVVKAQLREGHLPEARFSWEPLAALPEARPRAGLPPMLIRSFATRPEPLPPRPSREPDGWLPRGHEHGAAARSWGPYRLSGGWWRRELSRDYFFVEQQRGALLWIFEGPVKRWHLQGEVR